MKKILTITLVMMWMCTICTAVYAQENEQSAAPGRASSSPKDLSWQILQNITNEYQSIKDEIKNLNTSLNGIQSNISTLPSTESLQQAVETAVKQELGELSGKVANLPNAESLKDTVEAAVEAKLGELSGKVDSLPNAESMQQTVEAAVEAKLEKLSAKVDGLPNSEAVDRTIVDIIIFVLLGGILVLIALMWIFKGQTQKKLIQELSEASGGRQLELDGKLTEIGESVAAVTANVNQQMSSIQGSVGSLKVEFGKLTSLSDDVKKQDKQNCEDLERKIQRAVTEIKEGCSQAIQSSIKGLPNAADVKRNLDNALRESVQLNQIFKQIQGLPAEVSSLRQKIAGEVAKTLGTHTQALRECVEQLKAQQQSHEQQKREIETLTANIQTALEANEAKIAEMKATAENIQASMGQVTQNALTFPTELEKIRENASAQMREVLDLAIQQKDSMLAEIQSEQSKLAEKQKLLDAAKAELANEKQAYRYKCDREQQEYAELRNVREVLSAKLEAVRREALESNQRVRDEANQKIEAAKTKAAQELQAEKDRAAKELQTVQAGAEKAIQDAKDSVAEELRAAREEAKNTKAIAIKKNQEVIAEANKRLEAVNQKLTEAKSRAELEKMELEEKHKKQLESEQSKAARELAAAQEETRQAQADADKRVKAEKDRAEKEIQAEKANAAEQIRAEKANAAKQIQAEKDQAAAQVKAANDQLAEFRKALDVSADFWGSAVLEECARWDNDPKQKAGCLQIRRMLRLLEEQVDATTSEITPFNTLLIYQLSVQLIQLYRAEGKSTTELQKWASAIKKSPYGAKYQIEIPTIGQPVNQSMKKPYGISSVSSVESWCVRYNGDIKFPAEVK